MKALIYSAGLGMLVLAGGLGADAANMPAATASPPAYAAPVIADADAMKAADTLHHTNIRQQLQDQLAKAGYTDVKVMPSSFFVQAKDKQGNPVAMVIGPDSFTEVTDILSKPSTTAAAQPTAKPSTTVK